jgi:hypothetical protein
MIYEANYAARDELQALLQQHITGYECTPMPGDRGRMVIAIRKVAAAHFADGDARRRVAALDLR